MRDHAIVYVNGQRHRVADADMFLSLAEYLRRRLRLVGTKIVCEEGDCGACTVLVGRLAGGQLAYRPIDSCICFMFQLDACHIVTVEGLRHGGSLHPIQQAMIDCHGSQCGYCTPGFVMTMVGTCEQAVCPAADRWRECLTGNLCRCTGYTPILAAGLAAAERELPSLRDLFDESSMIADFDVRVSETISVTRLSGTSERQLFSPTNLEEALRFLAEHPGALIVAGATDIGVQINKKVLDPKTILDLNRIPQLATIETSDAAIIAGARATWSELAAVSETRIPEFYTILQRFGAPQIRHMGTIGGNLANASPIADSLPLLFVSEADIELQSSEGRRAVNIQDFYLGYKRTDRRPNELITRVKIPIPTVGQVLRLYKVSRRRDLDIASLTAAILLEFFDNQISEAAVAFGAVGPTVIRARRVEDFLRGRPFTMQTMEQAGDVAVSEISPITDVRGTAEYRKRLARNVLLKFFHEVHELGAVSQ